MTNSLVRYRRILFFEGSRRSGYWRRFAALLSLAVVIATVGLVRNSGAVVIAAMLIAPLMTPILGVASALVLGWTNRVLRLTAMIIVAASASIGLAYLMMLLADPPIGLALPAEVLARTDPGIEELLVALAAGIAGAYVQINRREVSLLPGAAIGVALVPPLAVVGILLYHGEFEGAGEAFVLFMTNFTAIVLAACGVYVASGMKAFWQQRARLARFGLGFVVMIAVVVGLTIQLGHATYQRFQELQDEERVALAVHEWANGKSVEIARLDVHRSLGSADVELWLIIDASFEAGRELRAAKELLPEGLDLAELQASLSAVLNPAATLALRVQSRFAEVISLDNPS